MEGQAGKQQCQEHPGREGGEAAGKKLAHSPSFHGVVSAEDDGQRPRPRGRHGRDGARLDDARAHSLNGQACSMAAPNDDRALSCSG